MTPALALNLELSGGRRGAAARVELHERPAGRLALLALRGWIDPPAARRIAQTLEELRARGVEQLLVDCSQVRHVDYRLLPALVEALARFEARAGRFALCGLSPYLRDLFRLAGCEPRLRCWSSAAELLVRDESAIGPGREYAT